MLTAKAIRKLRKKGPTVYSTVKEIEPKLRDLKDVFNILIEVPFERLESIRKSLTRRKFKIYIDSIENSDKGKIAVISIEV
jgi:adenylate cyclase class IV